MSWVNLERFLSGASRGHRHQTQVDLGNLGKIRFLETYMNPGDELLAPEELGRRIDDGLVESIWLELLRLEGDATRTEAFESTMDTIEKDITAHPALFAFKMSLWEEKEGEVLPPSAQYLDLARRHVKYGATRAPSVEEGYQIARVLLAPFRKKAFWETDWDRKSFVRMQTDSWLQSRDLAELWYYLQASKVSLVAWDTLNLICQQLAARGEKDIPSELLEWHFWSSHGSPQRPAEVPAPRHRPRGKLGRMLRNNEIRHMVDLLAQVGMKEADRYEAVAKGSYKAVGKETGLAPLTVSRICGEPYTTIADLEDEAMKRLEPSFYAYLYDSDSDSDRAQALRTFLESRS